MSGPIACIFISLLARIFKAKTMIQIHRFTFNSFMVNSYFLYDETGACIAVDAACYDNSEKEEIRSFLEKNKLKLTRHINTHCHIDHVLGNQHLADTYQIFPEYHKASIPFFYTAREIGITFGYRLDQIPEAKGYPEDGDEIRFGSSSLQVLYTPGHAEGSICLYSKEQGFVLTGDVLFKDTIGRTDLPGSDFDKLMESIKHKLFTLPDDTVVYPGHGPETTIGYEKMNNPFIR
jgi:glyoxylase-like metal-dependent hydrolase (beta-lactamase superfamily II)